MVNLEFILNKTASIKPTEEEIENVANEVYSQKDHPFSTLPSSRWKVLSFVKRFGKQINVDLERQREGTFPVYKEEITSRLICLFMSVYDMDEYVQSWADIAHFVFKQTHYSYSEQYKIFSFVLLHSSVLMKNDDSTESKTLSEKLATIQQKVSEENFLPRTLEPDIYGKRWAKTLFLRNAASDEDRAALLRFLFADSAVMDRFLLLVETMLRSFSKKVSVTDCNVEILYKKLFEFKISFSKLNLQ